MCGTQAVRSARRSLLIFMYPRARLLQHRREGLTVTCDLPQQGYAVLSTMAQIAEANTRRGMNALASDEFRRRLARCNAPAAEAYSLPPECYTDASILSAEIETLFRGTWLGIGRADRVAKPGDYLTLDIAGQSIIVLRDRDDKLHAFANTCRHRGARLLNGTGHCRGIRCPFHSWAYKLDGSLAAAPHMEDVPGFEHSENGLIAYRAEERLGFAFVCLDTGTPDIDHWLGGFADIHLPWPLAQLKATRRRSFVVNCNWKAFLEVFNEYYHLPFVHPNTVDGVYNAPEPGDVVSGAFTSQFGSTEGTGGLLEGGQDAALPAMEGLGAHAANGVRYTWIFPNMTFAAGRDALWVYEAYPLGADRCQVYQTACFPPETRALDDFDKRVAPYYFRLDAAMDEDIPALVNQQRGLRSPEARQGRFQPLLEHNVATFARWYAQHMG